MEREENGRVTIQDIAKKTGLSAATVSNALSGKQEVKIAEETRQKVLQACEELHYTKGAAKARVKKAGPTIADIAREAGVSSAMVSYVVNNRTDLKIAEETRKKILQICNLRQYHPSEIAKSLAAGKRNSNVVGIAFRYAPDCPAREVYLFRLIRLLQSSCAAHDYAVQLLPPVGERIEVREDIAGILCIDLSEEQFYTLKESYFVPIVALDMTVDDPLFYKAYDDFFALAESAQQLFGPRFAYVSWEYGNRPYLQKLEKAFGDRLYIAGSGEGRLAALLHENPDTVPLFCSQVLADLLLPRLPARRSAAVWTQPPADAEGQGHPILCMPAAEKADRAVKMLRSAILRNESEEHTFRLLPRVFAPSSPQK